MKIKSTSPVITAELQAEFEHDCLRMDEADARKLKNAVPCICGYFGRACYQMDLAEGANRALCEDCALRDFASRKSAADTITVALNGNGEWNCPKDALCYIASCLDYLADTEARGVDTEYMRGVKKQFIGLAKAAMDCLEIID